MIALPDDLLAQLDASEQVIRRITAESVRRYDEHWDHILPHARAVTDVDKTTERRIQELVAESLDRYREKWDVTATGEYDRLTRALENLDRALAALIAPRELPCHDEASVLVWLPGEGEKSVVVHESNDLDPENDSTVSRLWAVRQDIKREIENLEVLDRVR